MVAQEWGFTPFLFANLGRLIILLKLLTLKDN